MRWITILAILSLFTLHLSPAAAQEKKKPDKPANDCYAYNVMVYPKAGSKYEAIIVDPAFVKHLKTNESLDPRKFAPDARVTLQYMRGMNGSMGVRLKDLVSIVRLTPLSKADYNDVKKVIGKRIKKLNEQETIRIEKNKEKRAKEKKAREVAREREQAAKEEAARKQAQLDQFPLLKRFPPDKGWSKAMKEEIWRRKVIIKIFPKPEEQAFMDHFDEWEKQLKEWKALEEKKEKDAEKKPGKD